MCVREPSTCSGRRWFPGKKLIGEPRKSLSPSALASFFLVLFLRLFSRFEPIDQADQHKAEAVSRDDDGEQMRLLLKTQRRNESRCGVAVFADAELSTATAARSVGAGKPIQGHGKKYRRLEPVFSRRATKMEPSGRVSRRFGTGFVGDQC